MRFKLLNFFFAFLFTVSLSAQSDSISHKVDTLKNQVSIEIFGTGIDYSIGYERFLIVKPRFKLASRIGVGYYPFNQSIFSTPFEITTLWDNSNISLETGFGLTWCRYKRKIYCWFSTGPDTNIDHPDYVTESQLLYSFRFGYRYSKPNHRSSFRLSLTFLYELDEGILRLFYKQIPIGFTYGYRF